MDCNHEVVYNGLCALCGSDIESSEGQTHINMSHDSKGITVSRQEAERLEKENAERLLASRKLSLILDLDQTVVHATWDPTVGEWMNDENNANHPATKDIRRFTLPGSHFVYYIKLRPGLSEFLETISKLYELHIYTMGTRHYAEAVAREIDSTGKLFHNRILSRDESGSVTQKKIQRLFPCDTSMVVVLDDRSDVWSFSPNLIRIKPYEFFVGTGDINSPFAPRQPPDQDMLAKSKPLPLPEAKNENANEGSEDKGADEENEENGQDDESTRKKALDQQERLQEAMAQEQQEARPLAQQQSTQDRPLLVDDDRELYTMTEILKEIHQRFYNDEGRYERSTTDGAGSLQPKPDVTTLMPAMKKKVLEGVHIVFTGLIPQHQTLSSSTIWQLAESFGATCLPDLTGNVTHVVAARAGTDKVHRAQRIPNVHIVSEAWLSDSTARWKKQDEAEYALPELTPAGNEVENPESTPLEFDDEGAFGHDEYGLADDIDWDEADREVDDAINESGTDLGDTDSEASSASQLPRKGKRKRETDTDEESSAPGPQSPLTRIRQSAAQRGRSLLSQEVRDDASSSSGGEESEHEGQGYRDDLDDDEENWRQDYDENGGDHESNNNSSNSGGSESDLDDDNSDDESSSFDDFAGELDEEIE